MEDIVTTINTITTTNWNSSTWTFCIRLGKYCITPSPYRVEKLKNNQNQRKPIPDRCLHLELINQHLPQEDTMLAILKTNRSINYSLQKLKNNFLKNRWQNIEAFTRILDSINRSTYSLKGNLWDYKTQDCTELLAKSLNSPHDILQGIP